MEAYSLLALKLLMGILGLILQINLLGKGNLAPTSAMDQVQNFVLGGIIGGLIYSDSVGLLQFFLVLILWTLLVLSLKFIKNHNHWVKSVIDGKSVWIIVNGKVQAEECMKTASARMTSCSNSAPPASTKSLRSNAPSWSKTASSPSFSTATKAYAIR